MAILVPWARVLIAGDHLSPVEIPMVGEDRRAGRLPATRSTASSRSSEGADTVVPGHGEPLDAERALAILREDRDYLRALAAERRRRAAAARPPLGGAEGDPPRQRGAAQPGLTRTVRSPTRTVAGPSDSIRSR